MRYISLYIFFILTANVLTAQKYDYVWPLGGGSAPAPKFGGTTIDFNSKPTRMDSTKRSTDFDYAKGSICNKAGKLQFYTNGCEIHNYNNVLMDNGDGINKGSIYNDFCIPDPGYPYASGYPGPQSVVIIPWDNEEYQMLSMIDTIVKNTTIRYCHRLYSHTIDMNQNKGQGKVVKKNTIVYDDKMTDQDITLVKHSNGKDWWYVGMRIDTNLFLTFLIKKDTILGPFPQALGKKIKKYNYGQACFSPNGKKYVRCNEKDKVSIYDFDRATGTLSNPVYLLNLPNPDSGGVFGICISPNNRYLYVTCITKSFQFDLEAKDIAASKVLVAVYDGFVAPGNFLKPYMSRMWRGPDCRIYAGSAGGVTPLHVIHYPDRAGKACQFEQHAIIMPTRGYWEAQNYPNYRLDTAMPTCDSTLTLPMLLTDVSDIPNDYIFSTVSPNPSNGNITLELDLKEIPTAYWLLYNSLGQLLDKQPLAQYQSTYQFDYESLQNGLYFYTIGTKQKVLKSGKLVLVR